MRIWGEKNYIHPTPSCSPKFLKITLINKSITKNKSNHSNVGRECKRPWGMCVLVYFKCCKVVPGLHHVNMKSPWAFSLFLYSSVCLWVCACGCVCVCKQCVSCRSKWTNGLFVEVSVSFFARQQPQEDLVLYTNTYFTQPVSTSLLTTVWLDYML